MGLMRPHMPSNPGNMPPKSSTVVVRLSVLECSAIIDGTGRQYRIAAKPTRVTRIIATLDRSKNTTTIERMQPKVAKPESPMPRRS